MGDNNPEFGSDSFMERLLDLRKNNPAGYLMYPKEVRELVEQYEQEKEEKKPQQ